PMVRSSAHHRDIFGRGKFLGPDPTSDAYVVEVIAALDLFPRVGDLLGRRGRPLHQSCADRLVALLDLGEEWIETGRKGVGSAREGKHAAGAKRRGRLRIADRGIKPVPRSGGKNDIEPLAAGLPFLEGCGDNPHQGKLRELAARDSCEVGAQLHARYPAFASGERQRRLPGAAPNLKHSRAGWFDFGEREQIVEKLLWVFAAAPIVKLCDLIEGTRAPKPSLLVHRIG